jgi:hypothetical protein
LGLSLLFRPSLVLLFGGALLAGCGGAAPAGSPSRSPIVTVPALTSPPPVAIPTARISPTAAPWPAGWDTAFCIAFADVIVAQQVARDIGRALDDGATDDAIGLARELATRVDGIRTSLTDMPDWSGAEALLTSLEAMLNADDDLATFYLRYLEQGKSAALDRAHEVEDTLRTDAVPAVEAALAPLVDDGLTCPGIDLTLETP